MVHFWRSWFDLLSVVGRSRAYRSGLLARRTPCAAPADVCTACESASRLLLSASHAMEVLSAASFSRSTRTRAVAAPSSPAVGAATGCRERSSWQPTCWLPASISSATARECWATGSATGVATAVALWAQRHWQATVRPMSITVLNGHLHSLYKLSCEPHPSQGWALLCGSET